MCSSSVSNSHREEYARNNYRIVENNCRIVVNKCRIDCAIS